MGSDLRLELGVLEGLAQYIPNALNAWNLDDSQIEDVEKPRKELQDLLSSVKQHQGNPIVRVGPSGPKSKPSNKCHII